LFQLLAHVLCEAWQVGVVVPVGGLIERIHDDNSLPRLTVDTVAMSEGTRTGHGASIAARASTKREAQAKIDAKIGLSFDAITAGPLMIQDQAGTFMDMKPGPQKELIIKIFGVEIYEQYKKTAAGRVADYQQVVQRAQDEVLRLETILADEPDAQNALRDAKYDLVVAQKERERIEADLPEAGFTIADRRDPSPQVSRTLERLRQFLTLIGLTALLVGGVGIANAVATFIDKRRKVIATMKSIGATSRMVLGIFLAEVLAVAAMGVVLGLVLGFGLSLGFELRLRLCLEFRLNTRPEVARGARRHTATQLRRQRIGDRGPAFRRGRAAQRSFKLLRHFCEIVVGLRWSRLWHCCRRTLSRFGARWRSMLG